MKAHSAIALAWALVALPATAQTQSPAAQGTAPRPPAHMRSRAQHAIRGRLWQTRALHRRLILRRVARALHLTPQQRRQIRTQVRAAWAERRAICLNTALTPAQKRERLQALRLKVLRTIRDTLTPDQKAQLRSLRRRVAQRLWRRDL
ncbi:MAG: hypothetical protein ACP5VE_06245 [Chthonomonadales bacterium]